MTDTADDRVEWEEQIVEVTREEAEERPDLRADPAKSLEGVLDDEDPVKFQALELEATEEILFEDEGTRRVNGPD